MDFEDYCKSYVEPQKSENFEQQRENLTKLNDKKVESNSINEDEIKKKIDKYKNYNNQELLNELLKETNRQKKNGTLTDKKLDEMMNGLLPYLDNEQKQRMNEILKLLR